MYFEGGVGKKFFNPPYLPQFSSEGDKFFLPLDIEGSHFGSEFQDLPLKLRHRDMIIRIKTFTFFDLRRLFNIQSQKKEY